MNIGGETNGTEGANGAEGMNCTVCADTDGAKGGGDINDTEGVKGAVCVDQTAKNQKCYPCS